MFDAFRKAMMAGVGLAVMTKDRVEEMAREFAKTGEMSSEKGEQFVQEAMQQAEKARAEFENRVAAIVNDNLAKTAVATRSDIEKLLARIDALEQKLADKR